MNICEEIKFTKRRDPLARYRRSGYHLYRRSYAFCFFVFGKTFVFGSFFSRERKRLGAFKDGFLARAPVVGYRLLGASR